MALIGFHCEHRGNRSFQEWADEPCCRMKPYIRALLSNIKDRGREVSASNLSGDCMARPFLQATNDYYTPIEDMHYSSFRGALVHKMLEDNAEPGAIVEQRFVYRLYSGDEVSGTIDYYDPVTGVLWDYKTVSNIYGDLPKKDHTIQTNIYAFLLRKAGYEVKGIKVCYMSSDSVKIVDASIWPEENILALLEEKGSLLIEGMRSGVQPAPKPGYLCNERNGKSYCSVKPFCSYWSNPDNFIPYDRDGIKDPRKCRQCPLQGQKCYDRCDNLKVNI